MAMPKRRVPRTCEWCKREFTVTKSQADLGFGKFCSLACRKEAKSQPQDGRVCTGCGEYKVAAEFDQNPSQPKRLRPECRACRRARARAYYARTRESRRETAMLRQFGISRADYDALLAAQGGRCAICRTAEPGNGFDRLLVDHCHSSRRVRGLLCSACNAGLGNFRDDPGRLRSAITYLGVNATPE